MGKRERWRDGGATLYVDRGAAHGDRGAAPGMPAGHPERLEAAAEVPLEVPVEVPLEGPLEVPLEVAASYRARTRGLLGRDGIEGAMLLTPASSVHTFRMRFAIDVAHLDRRLTVIALTTMVPGRLGLPGCAPATSWRPRPEPWPPGACASAPRSGSVSPRARRGPAPAVGWGG